MLATISSAALQGIDAEIVHVEVNSGETGEPKLILVGLPDAAVKESDDRVFSALSNSGFKAPRTRTTINLAPGNLRKEGPFYDLPIALGILVATEQIPAIDTSGYLIAGELSLSGATRPVRGALALARLARKLGKRGVLLPPLSAQEAALVEGVAAYPVTSLDHAVRFLTGEITLLPVEHATAISIKPEPDDLPGDFSEIKGQHALRRAVEVAAAGGHNLLIIGPPGAGKGTQAVRLSTALSLPHVATGDLFRENLSQGTPLGTRAKTYMDAGQLVPDDVVLEMLFDRVSRKDCSQGYLLDGFPRTIAQAEALEERLASTRAQVGKKFLRDHESDAIRRTAVARATWRRAARPRP